MSRDPSPKSARWAVRVAVSGDVAVAVGVAVNDAVDLAVRMDVGQAVWLDVSWAVAVAVDWAVIVSPPHPNLQRFVSEVRQTRARWGVA